MFATSPSANSGTARIVKEYVKRVASHDLEEYPEWDLTKPLPKLPVPTLSHTLEMYLKVLEPITTVEQYARAKGLVEEFQRTGGTGEELQAKLHQFAEQTDNWAYDWWLNDMYLLSKLPLPINSSPGMVFPRTHFSEPGEQLRFAARLVSGILDYKVIIDARALPIDRARHREKGQPLCMEQYYRLFSSYRVPGEVKDSLIMRQTSPSEPEHIIVIYRNQLFKLDIANAVARLSEDDICCQLRRICRLADESVGSGQGIGILTSLPRNEWARCRQTLLKDKVNQESLELIQNSIFILCLDQAVPIILNHQRSIDDTDQKIRDENSLASQMLHGQGAQINSSNRWYDKTMQFIIGEDGACGLNYEHSPSEGIAVVQLIEHVLKYMEELRKRKLVRMNSIVELPYPTRLHWVVSNETEQGIEQAKFKMDQAIANLDFYYLRYTKYGKNFPKNQDMSPDCLIQLALQLTFYRVHGHLVSTYESASTRRFRLGRVDNIRAASSEALLWCKVMVGEITATDEEKLSLLRQAMQAQTDIMVQTILGHGMDCHMLALKCIAEEQGVTPDLFSDETWSISNKFRLSTSQVLTTLDSFISYGPVVHNGYGASYNPHPNHMVFCISSFKSCPVTKSDQFALTLEQVLTDIYDLCNTLNTKKLLLQTIAEDQLVQGAIHSLDKLSPLSNDDNPVLIQNGCATPASEKSGINGEKMKSSPRRLTRQYDLDLPNGLETENVN